ncbi:hypothetical protein D3C72_2135500 [compost metagenome]
MNSDSNCLAASRVTCALLAVPASYLRALSERMSTASALEVLDVVDDEGRERDMVKPLAL